jgi:hypothetical protein
MNEPLEVDILLKGTPEAEAAGHERTYETLPVRKAPSGGLELLVSPSMVYGVAAGDVIELDEGERFGYRVISRGGRVCTHVIISRTLAENAVAEWDCLVEECGGTRHGLLLQESAGIVVYTFLDTVGFAAIEKVMTALVGSDPDLTWSYNNVYEDPEGTVPMGWWEK